jgi:hypothetical protein
MSSVDQSMIDEKNREGYAYYERHRSRSMGSQSGIGSASKPRGLASAST